VNVTDEYFQGTAIPNSTLDYWSSWNNGEDVVVDGSGTWTINLPEGVIVPGFWIEVAESDEDGDRTNVRWELQNPIIVVIRDDNKIHGNQWESESPVSVYIYHDGETISVFNETVMTNTDGNFDLRVSDYSDYTMVAGDRIVVSDVTSTKEHIVTSLTMTEVNVTDAYFRGTAIPNSTLDYWSSWNNGEGVVVDGSGTWTINLPEGVIVPGFWIEVAESDEDGDRTNVKWENVE
jgi:hypothetical protein